MAEITAVFPKSQRRTAMAVDASILALARVTGPALGGLLIDRFGRRSVFLVVAAVGSVGLDSPSGWRRCSGWSGPWS